MRKTETKSVTVGVSALNEEHNIQKLLRSICAQHESNFTLKEIIVFSDRSTDSTVKKVRAVHDSRIRLIVRKVRKGKIAGLQELFNTVQSDLLVVFDADVVLGAQDTIAHLIQPTLINPKVAMVCGRAKPREGKTFVERCVNTSYETFDAFRIRVKGGNTAYTAEGKIYCLTRRFFSRIRLPDNIDSDDNFLYFSCTTRGFVYRYARTAYVWYRSPTTFADQITQNSRYLSRFTYLTDMFGDIVTKEYSRSKREKYLAQLWMFIRKPVYSIGILAINLYCKYKALSYAKVLRQKWRQVSTTKQDI